MSSFLSDNNSGLCPEALASLNEIAGKHTPGYGDDPDTSVAKENFRKLFGEETDVFFAATGTAANLLALASLTNPWERLLCHRHSHLAADESSGPEFFTGCRLVAISTPTSKLRPEDIRRHDNAHERGVHQTQPGAVTITNPTEFGEVYTAEETRELCQVAHELGYQFHVDGACFANAVAYLECDPSELTRQAGIDALTFGGTKNGLAAGEAVVFFHRQNNTRTREAVRRFPFLRKRSGHLVSKHRFITAPFAAALERGAWLRHASHANALAAGLGEDLEKLGFAPRFPVQTNGVFVSPPQPIRDMLDRRGYRFNMPGEAEWELVRFMVSFDTTRKDVDELLQVISDAM